MVSGRWFDSMGAMLRGLLPAVALTLAACASPSTSTALKVKVEVLDALNRYEHAYVLQPGDQLEVFLYRQPEFSRKTIIRPDGAISLPLVNEVKASGRTPADLAQELTKLFAERLVKPEVTVMVENPPEPMVYVVGQVGQPRALPLRQARTVVQALAQAGDATQKASAENVQLIRINKDGFLESRSIETNGLAPSQPDVYLALSNMTLQTNDVILVPESGRSQLLRTLSDVNTALSPLFNLLIVRAVTK
ncbi:polysaccharide biosynthesis/export family protein [Piscinibacter terrae]|uniref:polysaccharide biosynthesis/export family protein n=1 Tax=Piscinibacter terrae TaxID=2496871 RepID=UPI0013874586|nr:polysaccharide biosynthesis/export family protein [Albitalea terrae]